MEDATRRAILNASPSTETPFYLLNLDRIRARFRALHAAWAARFPNLVCAYSFKSNSNHAITRALRECGMWAEVVSGVELEWALLDGFSPDTILFDGPVKLKEELHRALQLGVSIQMDSLDELETIVDYLRAHPSCSRFSVRLAVDYREQGLSRFGFLPEELPAVVKGLASVNRSISGVHLHAGSNLRDPEIYVNAILYILPLLKFLMSQSSELFRLDIGGGFPAQSSCDTDPPPPDELFAGAVAQVLTENDVALVDLQLVIEPGRVLVEDFGWLVNRVVVTKQRGPHTLLFTDGGSNLTRSLQWWHHEVEFLKEGAGKQDALYTVFGANCFEGDLLGVELPGPRDLTPGDLVVISNAGGYDIPGANAWIRPLPEIIAIDGGQIRTVRARQSLLQMRAQEPGGGVGCGVNY